MSAEKPLTPEPLSDVELDVIRMWTNIGDQSDKGKLAARGLLLTVDRLKARERKLVGACRSVADKLRHAFPHGSAVEDELRAAIEEDADGK